MIKEVVEFLVSYPTWVKVSVVVLAAAMGLLLIIFRPVAKGESKEDSKVTPRTHIFRIERLESSKGLNDISLTVSINGQTQRFPSAYEFAAYEQNMAGGEYILPSTADEFIIELRAWVQFEESGFRDPKLRPVTLGYQLRQPLRLLKGEIPKRGVETLRAIEEHGMRQSRSRKDYYILVHYSVS
jgi:hypothetical protein